MRIKVPQQYYLLGFTIGRLIFLGVAFSEALVYPK